MTTTAPAPAPASAPAPTAAPQPQARPEGRPAPRGGPRPGGRPRGRYAPRRRVCSFCVEHVKHIDYKDVDRLRRFLSDRAKIEPSRKSGVCAKHQRALSTAIKRARHLAMLPFVPIQSYSNMRRR